MFKCFLNTFKIRLDVSVGSALSMSLQSMCKSYSVCVHFFVFLNRNAFEVCVSAKRSQNGNIPTGRSRLWSATEPWTQGCLGSFSAVRSRV